MYPILIPTHDIAPDLRLILILYSLSPAALASWLQDRFPEIDKRSWIGWYSIVLAGVASFDAAILGTTVRFSQVVPTGSSIGLGLLLGGIAVLTDFAVRRVAAWLRNREKPRATFTVSADSLLIAPADVPWATVSWKFPNQRASWQNRLPSSLLGAALEEYIYRKALLELLTPLFPSVAFPAFVSTLFFGLTHFQFGVSGVISKWIIGAVFVTAVLAGGGLMSVIIGHLVLNTAAYLSMRETLGRAPVVALRVAKARY